MEHGPEQDPAAVAAPRAPDPVSPPTVDGVAVRELGLLILPAPNGPAFLVTPTYSGEFSRVNFSKDGYAVGKDGGRLGEYRCVGCDVVHGRGAVVRFNSGHLVRIPEGTYHITWLP